MSPQMRRKNEIWTQESIYSVFWNKSCQWNQWKSVCQHIPNRDNQTCRPSSWIDNWQLWTAWYSWLTFICFFLVDQVVGNKDNQQLHPQFLLCWRCRGDDGFLCSSVSLVSESDERRQIMWAHLCSTGDSVVDLMYRASAIQPSANSAGGSSLGSVA